MAAAAAAAVHRKELLLDADTVPLELAQACVKQVRMAPCGFPGSSPPPTTGVHWLSIIQPSRAVTQLADWHTRSTTRCTAPCPPQVKQWCPAATSVAAARVGSGALALTLAESFDIVHAFEADETRCRYLQANVELTGRDWIVVHGVPTEEEGDYLFAADEMECDVVFLSLLCPDHDLDRVNADPEASSPAGAPRLPPPTPPTAAVRGAVRPLCVQPRTYTA